MTREESIDRLRKISEKTPIRTNGDDLVAITMAIQALEQNESAEEWYKLFVEKLDEQEPCTDAVSRQKVMDIVKAYDVPLVIRTKIKCLPSVNPQPCDDAIDRAEAMTEIMMFAGNVKPDEEDIYIKVSDAVQLLRELPPVTPKPVECNDAISRDIALEKMADYVASGYADSAEDFEEYSRIICQLPSVTHKAGKWIEHPEIETSTPEYLDRHFIEKADVEMDKYYLSMAQHFIDEGF